MEESQITSNSICGGIVTYNPDIRLLKFCLEAIVNQVDYLCIIDNNSNNKNEIGCLVSSYHKVVFISLDKNYGVAYALNLIAKEAIRNNCLWFLTLDQDSECEEHMIDEYVKYISDDTVGMICPRILLRIHKSEVKKQIANVIEYVDLAITSGCLVRTSAWDRVGGFWQYLFIDRVDDDFCLSLSENNYKILRVNTITLEHEIGRPKKHRFMGHSYYSDSYPPLRYYYIARNTVIVYSIHKTNLNVFRLLLVRFVKILLSENNRFKLMSSYFKGIKDGLCYIIRYKTRQEIDV